MIILHSLGWLLDAGYLIRGHQGIISCTSLSSMFPYWYIFTWTFKEVINSLFFFSPRLPRKWTVMPCLIIYFFFLSEKCTGLNGACQLHWSHICSHPEQAWQPGRGGCSLHFSLPSASSSAKAPDQAELLSSASHASWKPNLNYFKLCCRWYQTPLGTSFSSGSRTSQHHQCHQYSWKRGPKDNREAAPSLAALLDFVLSY